MMKTTLSVLVIATLLIGCSEGDSGAKQAKVIEVSGDGFFADFSITNVYDWDYAVKKATAPLMLNVVGLYCEDDVATDPDTGYRAINMSVNIDKLTEGLSFEEDVKERARRAGTVVQLTEQPSPVSFVHESGWTYAYAFSDDVIDSVVHVYYFNVGNVIYMIEAESTPEHYESHSKEKFAAMLNTFDIKE